MIPKIDSEIGISVYATQSNGTDGRIKTSNDTFIVKEILSDKALKSISDNNGTNPNSQSAPIAIVYIDDFLFDNL